MHKDYQIHKDTKGLLPWSHFTERMSKSKNYWIGTTRPDGRPHVMPVWGVWIDKIYYFSTARHSRKARNIDENQALVVHLESGDDVVILEGVAREARDASELEIIDKAYFAKYKMHILSMPGDIVIYAVAPRKAFAWREKDFPVSATRWLLHQS